MAVIASNRSSPERKTGDLRKTLLNQAFSCRPNKQLQRTVIRHRGDDASAPFRGGRAEFYVGVNGPGSFGFEFNPALMADLCSMGLTLSVEVFPVPQNA